MFRLIKQSTLIAALGLLLVAGSGVGGYMPGQSEAPTDADAAKARDDAYALARAATRASSRKTSQRQGEREGLAEGREVGLREGHRAGKADAKDKLAAIEVDEPAEAAAETVAPPDTADAGESGAVQTCAPWDPEANYGCPEQSSVYPGCFEAGDCYGYQDPAHVSMQPPP